VREGRLDHEAVVPALEAFLRDLLRVARFDLQAEIREVPGPPATDSRRAGEADVESVELEVRLDGRDAELLLERKGELLLALEHIALRWLRLEPRFHDHIRFDCRDYRAGRVAELKLAAETAAARVRQGRTPFRFQPMNARERRILHLALKEAPGVRSVSEGERDQRAVVIYPA
jgi:spoIIIJ-associated protein